MENVLRDFLIQFIKNETSTIIYKSDENVSFKHKISKTFTLFDLFFFQRRSFQFKKIVLSYKIFNESLVIIDRDLQTSDLLLLFFFELRKIVFDHHYKIDLHYRSPLSIVL